MKYKIGAILLVGLIFTLIIYFKTEDKGLDLLTLGDGISSGMTPYHIEGYDFNDYLSEYLNENNTIENYYKNFSEADETIVSLLNKININISSIEKKIKIKQAIQKSDIITISLGMDELNNYASKKLLGSSKINAFLNKYEELLNNITRLNKNKIFVISLYESNLINASKIAKINDELKKICQKYQVNYVDITEIKKEPSYFIEKNNYYPNYKGQKFIFEKIKEVLNSQNIITI